jgi:ligand-binding SRPBCC domain-containing protein
MGRVESSVEIGAPIEKVFVFFSNPKNQERVFVDYDMMIEDVSKQPVGVGTRYRPSCVIAGIKAKPHLHEFVEFEKNRRIVDREVRGGGGSLKREELTYAFGTTDRGTKMTLTIDYKLPYSVIGEALDKLRMRKAFENFSRDGVQKAREILEATPPRPTETHRASGMDA